MAIRSRFEAGTSFRKIWALSMRHSSRSRQPKQRVWTLSTGECWRQYTMLWKMVSQPSTQLGARVLVCEINVPSAGVSMDKCSGSDTSVYTGCFTNDYLSILQQDYEAEQRHAAMGIAPSMLANRLSWFFNLKGTSVNLDSACSSSLLALHLACQDLHAGTTSMVGTDYDRRPYISSPLS